MIDLDLMEGNCQKECCGGLTEEEEHYSTIINEQHYYQHLLYSTNETKRVTQLTVV